MPTIPELVAQELADPRFGVTQQFLAIHHISYEAGQPLIRRITTTEDGGHVAYLAVENQRFYFALYFAPEANEVRWVGTEAFHSLSLRATSSILSSAELAALTRLLPTAQWNKGDLRRVGGARQPASGLDFTLPSAPTLLTTSSTSS
ncbi:hypothetical protein [Hymenobacter cellulosilyticus]|uniref:Uncharacterized protein n=1 Tax=Hymenobacter cellulosilyticus TaxID=2932248 RepID=A0A8T9QBF5_9BACT|nr:hypothetical protein [Hymenobacter cellulosilyticus]UOQ74515.1 hypothetical protein MUN79_11900 [Hymenobacter cellulosilyticus]